MREQIYSREIEEIKIVIQAPNSDLIIVLAEKSGGDNNCRKNRGLDGLTESIYVLAI